MYVPMKEHRKKGVNLMKQVIVLVAMIILGVGVAGFVMDFKDDASTITTNASSFITTTFAGEMGGE